jgi:hypothetical protein
LGQRYVRGCSAFAGFAKGGFNRERLEQFSDRMAAALGERWSLWGSEQVASNFMIANAMRPEVLPYPAYASYVPRLDVSRCRFTHFIGSFRFKDGTYEAMAGNIIKQLMSGDESRWTCK